MSETRDCDFFILGGCRKPIEVVGSLPSLVKVEDIEIHTGKLDGGKQVVYKCTGTSENERAGCTGYERLKII